METTATTATTAPSHDRMLQALLDAKASIEDALSGQQERSSYITVLSADPARVWEVASRLVADARRQVTCVCPPEGFTAGRLRPAVDQFTAIAGQGVAVRLLLPTSASRATLYAEWPTGPTAATRVTSQPLLEMMLVDDRVALIGFPAEPGYKSLLVRAPSILRVLSRLYGADWQDARPLEEYSWASVVSDLPDPQQGAAPARLQGHRRVRRAGAGHVRPDLPAVRLGAHAVPRRRLPLPGRAVRAAGRPDLTGARHPWSVRPTIAGITTTWNGRIAAK